MQQCAFITLRQVRKNCWEVVRDIESEVEYVITLKKLLDGLNHLAVTNNYYCFRLKTSYEELLVVKVQDFHTLSLQ